MSYLGPQNATITVVPGTTTSVTLFSETAKSSGRIVYNDSPAVLFLAYGTAAIGGQLHDRDRHGGHVRLPATRLRRAGHGRVGVHGRLGTHHLLVR